MFLLFISRENTSVAVVVRGCTAEYRGSSVEVCLHMFPSLVIADRLMLPIVLAYWPSFSSLSRSRSSHGTPADCCCIGLSLLILLPAVVIWRRAARLGNSPALCRARPFLRRGPASSKSSWSGIRASGRPASPTAFVPGSSPRKQRPRSAWTSGRGWWRSTARKSRCVHCSRL